MRKEDLKASFDKIKPGESDKKRMLDNILNQYEKKKGFAFLANLNYKKAIPALALAVAIAAGSAVYYRTWRNYTSPYENSVADDAGLSAREDMAAPLLNQFRIDDRHYILLSDDLRKEYGLPSEINESDIGEKIADIANTPDDTLVGSEVYRYIPAGGEAVVAVKKENEYRLFRFFVFESYNNNQDEDATRYLELYGINSADDIAKIQFIVYSEQSKLEGRTDVRREIANRDEIVRFYGFYSKLKNSSDRYFDRLFGVNNTGGGIAGGVETDAAAPDIGTEPEETVPDMRVPPDKAGPGMADPDDIPVGSVAIAEDMPLVIESDSKVGAATDSGGTAAVSADNQATGGGRTGSSHGVVDMGNTESGVVEPSIGSIGNALDNPVTIRIYNRNGIFYDSVYYVNIGFINRYEVSEEFAGYLSDIFPSVN